MHFDGVLALIVIRESYVNVRLTHLKANDLIIATENYLPIESLNYRKSNGFYQNSKWSCEFYLNEFCNINYQIMVITKKNIV